MKPSASGQGLKSNYMQDKDENNTISTKSSVSNNYAQNSNYRKAFQPNIHQQPDASNGFKTSQSSYYEP